LCSAGAGTQGSEAGDRLWEEYPDARLLNSER